MIKCNTRRAFTLIELSIVLIILSLITAGVVGGKSLIHSAEVMSVITDVSEYKIAFNTYQLQYNALPGDHINAVDYFGMVTLNGNGDWMIKYTDPAQEDFVAWEHLALAELISGSYPGTCGGSYRIGDNIAASEIKDAGYQIHYDTVYGKQGNHIQISSNNGIWIGGGVLTPEDAQSIDNKMDDGKADAGKIYTTNGKNKNGCTTGDKTDASGDYILSTTSEDCRMYFWLD